MRTRRLWAVALAAFASLATADHSWAQSRGAERPATVDCVAQCRVDPLKAPAECDCMTAGKRRQPGAGGSASDTDLDPARVLANMQADYEASIAGVDNYLVVEKINISPLPSIVYYEKVQAGQSNETAKNRGSAGRTAKSEGPAGTPAAGGGRTYFRQVPPNELAQREAKANAAAAKTADAKAGAELMANPSAFLGALASGLDALGKGAGSGIVEEASSGLADALRTAQSDITGQAQEDAKDSGDEHLGLISELLEIFNKDREVYIELPPGVYQTPPGIRERYGIYFPDRGTPEQRFYSVNPPYRLSFHYPNVYRVDQGRIKAERWGWKVVKKSQIPTDGVRCAIFIRNKPIDFEYRGITHTLEEGEVWVAEDVKVNWGGARYSFHRPLMVRIKATVRALGTNGYQRIVIDRETDDYRKAGPMRVPHRTRQRMTMNGKALPEIVKSIRKISVNEGPPTQAQIAAILAEASERPGQAAPSPK